MTEVFESQNASPDKNMETIDLLDKANSILNSVENKELRKKFEWQYNKIRETVINAFFDGQEQTINSLDDLKLSLDIWEEWEIDNEEYLDIEKAVNLFSADVTKSKTIDTFEENKEAFINEANSKDLMTGLEWQQTINSILQNSTLFIEELEDLRKDNNWELTTVQEDMLSALKDYDKEKIYILKDEYKKLQELMDQDITGLKPEFFKDNPEYIYLIKDEARLKEIIKSNNTILIFKLINPQIIKNNPDIIFESRLLFDDIKNLDSNFVKNNIEEFIIKFDYLKDILILKSNEYWVSKNELRDIIHKNNIKTSITIDNFLSPNSINLSNFWEAYKDIMNWNINDQNRDIINKYLLQNLKSDNNINIEINNDSKNLETMVIDLIGKWLLDWKTDLIYAQKTIGISKALIEKSSNLIHFIPKEHMQDKEILSVYIEQLDNSEYIFNEIANLDIPDLDTLLFIYSKVKQKENVQLKQFFIHPIIKTKIQNLLSAESVELKEWFSNQKDKELFTEIINELNGIKTSIEEYNKQFKTDIKFSKEENDKFIESLDWLDLNEKNIKNINNFLSSWEILILWEVFDNLDIENINLILEIRNKILDRRTKEKSKEVKGTKWDNSEWHLSEEKLVSDFKEYRKKQKEWINNDIIINEFLIDSRLNSNSEEYKKITDILKDILEKEQNSTIIKSDKAKDIFRKVVKWEISQEEFNKVIFEETIRIEKEEKEEQAKQEEKTNTNDINSSFEVNDSKNDYWLNTLWDKPELLWNNWEKIEITAEEAQIVKNNPEAIKNLVDFHNFFKELNLESVWKYRKELAITIGSVNIDFNDGNSISKAELLSFWNKLLKAINWLMDDDENLKDKPRLYEASTLSALESEFRKFSGAWSMLSDNATSNIEWEDKFAATLRQFWVIGWAYFKTNLLREKMK